MNSNRETNRAILRAVMRQIEESGAPEYQWLFILAGVLKAYYPCDTAIDTRPASEFESFAIWFGYRMCDLEVPCDYIKWSSAEAVVLEFEAAWKARREAHGLCFLDRAIELAGEEDWLDLGIDNYLVGWVATAGFVMQELQPGKPFYIPVNEAMAERFGTTKRTLQLVLNKAIQMKLLRVETPAKELLGSRQARRLTFNYRHRRVKGKVKSTRAALRKRMQVVEDPRPEPVKA